MVVGPDGRLPLPWLADPLAEALAVQRGHALLVHAAPGVGALEFAVVLAQAWLCERAPVGVSPVASSSAPRPCGVCSSCRMASARVHADLLLLMPETLRRSLAWPLQDDKPDDDAKRKPSRQIRVDEVRALIDWTNMTSAAGRGKVAVLHPAESMNLQAANALLKTLEEPPEGTRLILTCSDPARLLPTVLSRCQRLRLQPPSPPVALTWLSEHGVDQPEVLLAACAGRPLEALALHQAGIDAATWAALPGSVARGQAAVFSGWPIPQLVQALLKLCHDAMATTQGAAAQYFPPTTLPTLASLPALLVWAESLRRVLRDAEHPWNEALLLESMVGQGRQALAPASGMHKPGF